MAAKDWGSERWSLELAARYFSPASAGEPVLYAVDREVLASITGADATTAVDMLCEAVGHDVMPGHRFDVVRSACERWQAAGADGPPPSLPLLAVCVLAAASMDSGNYYKPLRQLLDPSDAQAGMPVGYDQAIPWMWKQLRWWLGDHLGGSRGLPAIDDPQHFTNIGYSLQQAALRETDKRLVYRFFRSIGLRPDEEQIIGGELRRALRVWAKAAGPRAQRVHRFVAEDSWAELAEPMLESLARTWDGRLTSAASGVRALPLRLVLELRPIELRWVAPRVAEDPEHLEVTGDQRWTLRGEGGWYEVASAEAEPTEHHLKAGIELTGTDRQLFHEPRGAIPFRYDDDLLEFVSVDRIRFGEKHLLLFRAALLSSIKPWFEAEGVAFEVFARATPDLPPGWLLCKDLVIDAAPLAVPPAPIADLIGESGGGHRIRLRGGLKLPGLGRSYLTGGAPDIVLPPEAGGLAFTITTEGFDPQPATPHEGKVELSAWPLRSGEYHLEYGDLDLTFHIVDGVAGMPGTDVGSITTSASDGRSAAGLLVSGPGPTGPHFVPAPKEDELVVAIGPRPGDVQHLSTPKWLGRILGVLTFSAVDLWVDFEPAWLLTTKLTGPPKYYARCVSPIAPSGSDPASPWARLIASAHLDPGAPAPHAALWTAYRQAAGAGGDR